MEASRSSGLYHGDHRSHCRRCSFTPDRITVAQCSSMRRFTPGQCGSQWRWVCVRPRIVGLSKSLPILETPVYAALEFLTLELGRNASPSRRPFSGVGGSLPQQGPPRQWAPEHRAHESRGGWILAHSGKARHQPTSPQGLGVNSLARIS